jgi:hypothetical protein
MCAVMNGASDINLALAVHEAQAMPSLALNRYDSHGAINYDIVHDCLMQFKQSTGHCDLVFAVAEEDLLDFKFLKLLKSFGVSFLEFLPNQLDSSATWNDSAFLLGLSYAKNFAKIMVRVVDKPCANSHVDAYCIKGQESAGFGGNVSVKDLFVQQKNLTPAQFSIPYGGIGTPGHVRYYMDQGAGAVAVGTLFAASQESCLDIQVKQKICNTAGKDLVRFSDTGQQALILDNKKTVDSNGLDWNREHSLQQGLHGNGSQGHIYLGQSVDHVTEIKSVRQVVDYLVDDIRSFYE